MEHKLLEIQEKWQKKWSEEKIFEPEVDNNKQKFFLTFPYPYINAYSHIGHVYTLARVDAFARFKRAKGFNVLFPQGWHATGSPIVNAAKRVKSKEQKQMKIMADMGITDSEELKKFEKPEYWLEFFQPEFRKDYKLMGMSIDWRREFHTTSLNPHYDKFIKWQFNTLKEKGYVIKGKFPVVWCPKCNNAVGDHSRSEGEGESAQEFTLIKFKLENSNEFIVVATLRPETMYGQTNIWIGSEQEYVRAKVDNETWIISEVCSQKLQQQKHEVKIISKILGKELIGKNALAPYINRQIPIWPSNFCKPDKGTGIVTSVPSDAPDDYIGLMDLKNSPELCQKYELNNDEIKKIEVIPIIDAGKLGNKAAEKICKDFNITNQNQREKLEKAKKIVYKKGFYEGKMLDNCGVYSGMPVEKAKDAMKQELLSQGLAIKFYELTGKVVCRCLTPCVVKIVDNQWFLNYADEEWKKLTHECLDNLKLYPEKSRDQFHNVIDWLHEWACTREEGLGTKLPWDEKWLIESLSDSTIYMAYYTIAHKIKDIEPEKLDDAFFNYVFLNKETEIKVDKKIADELKKEFEYWYPVDFRNSGKDLIQNHLTFYMFNHTAIFPKEKWPQSIGVNGWVTVNGEKMSKSLGNMIPLRDMAEKYSADVSRATILSGGESLDDPNWDSSLAKTLMPKLAQWLEFSKEIYDTGRDNIKEIDIWMTSKLNEIIKSSEESYSLTLFRTAFQTAYFELSRALKWYLRRCNNSPNKEIINRVIESQAIMVSPIVPHVAEELWNLIGKKGFVSLAEWPVYDETKIIEDSEWIVSNLMNDIIQVLKLAKIDKPAKIKLFISSSWKYNFYDILSEKLNETRNPKDIISAVMQTDLKKHSKEIMKIIPKVIKAGSLPKFVSCNKEKELIEQSKEFLETEFGCQVIIESADNSSESKASSATPSKPAVLVE